MKISLNEVRNILPPSSYYMVVDRSWINENQISNVYENDIGKFLQFLNEMEEV